MKAVAILLAATLAVGAFAQAKKTTSVCAVMPKMKVDIAKATKEKLFADYKGRRYFFCCAGCPGMFKKNPGKYAKADSIPTPKGG